MDQQNRADSAATFPPLPQRGLIRHDLRPGADDGAVPQGEFASIDEVHDLGAECGAWVEDGSLLYRYWHLIADPHAPVAEIQKHMRHLFQDEELMIPASAMITLVAARHYLHPAACGAAVRNQWLGGGLDGPADMVEALFRTGHLCGGLMTPAESDFLDSLPDEICAYRGCMFGCESPIGMSWTLDVGIADLYTRCDGQPNGKILRARFPKAAVLAYLAEREERELVVDAARVIITGSRTGTSTKFPDRMASLRW